MSFTDDEVLLLLDLDVEIDVDGTVVASRWARMRNAAWWVTVAVGSMAAMYLFLSADYGVLPPRSIG